MKYELTYVCFISPQGTPGLIDARSTLTFQVKAFNEEHAMQLGSAEVKAIIKGLAYHRLLTIDCITDKKRTPPKRKAIV